MYTRSSINIANDQERSLPAGTPRNGVPILTMGTAANLGELYNKHPAAVCTNISLFDFDSQNRI